MIKTVNTNHLMNDLHKNIGYGIVLLEILTIISR